MRRVKVESDFVVSWMQVQKRLETLAFPISGRIKQDRQMMAGDNEWQQTMTK